MILLMYYAIIMHWLDVVVRTSIFSGEPWKILAYWARTVDSCWPPPRLMASPANLHCSTAAQEGAPLDLDHGMLEQKGCLLLP